MNATNDVKGALPDLSELLENLSPELYELLKNAIEIGKWADGSRMSREQVEQAMQIVIAYEANNVAADQRVGYISDNACRKEPH